MRPSSSPWRVKVSVRNGSFSPSTAVSAAAVIAAASRAWSKNGRWSLRAGSTSRNSAPVRVLARYQNRLPSLSHCGATESPLRRRPACHGRSCSARSYETADWPADWPADCAGRTTGAAARRAAAVTGTGVGRRLTA